MKRIIGLVSVIQVLVLWCGQAWGQQPERLQDLPTSLSEPLNPLDFGLREAADGKERYAALYACHKEAFAKHRPISYAGIDTIVLEIPDTAKSLPLPYRTDFAGVVINVRNDRGKDINLFSMGGDAPAKEIWVDPELLDSNDLRGVPDLVSGNYLLVVKDQEKWTERIGYGYECFRSDLIYVVDGHSRNLPVTSYTNPVAKPKFHIIPVTTEEKTIENITIHRGRDEKSKTFCFYISNQNNVTLRNIHITTPKTKFNADHAIDLVNCANCRLQDVTVDSTYSYPGGYGYAIAMNNVWNIMIERLRADAAWGVFGTNNVNNITLRECDVNRFDIHCYGRDAHLVNCVFRNKQTQFSSMYGEVVFDSCHFIDCLPVRIRSSYNAYTPFDIRIRHCTFDITLKHHALVNVMLQATEANARPELAARCWPNVFIEDLTVNLSPFTRRLDIIDPTGTVSECKKPVDYLERIEINGLRTLRKGREQRCAIRYSSRAFKTKERYRGEYKNVENGGGKVVVEVER